MERYQEKELVEFEKELIEERRVKKQQLYRYLFAVMCFFNIFLAGVLVYIISATSPAF